MSCVELEELRTEQGDLPMVQKLGLELEKKAAASSGSRVLPKAFHYELFCFAGHDGPPTT